jgi:hypothetical protein
LDREEHRENIIDDINMCNLYPDLLSKKELGYNTYIPGEHDETIKDKNWNQIWKKWPCWKNIKLDFFWENTEYGQTDFIKAFSTLERELNNSNNLTNKEKRKKK